MKKPKRLSSECWIVFGETGFSAEELERWVVRVFWGRHAERAAHEHAANATMHDTGLVKEWHQALGEWSNLPLDPRTGEAEEPMPVKGVNKYDPERPADAGSEAVRYTVKRAVFTRLF